MRATIPSMLQTVGAGALIGIAALALLSLHEPARLPETTAENVSAVVAPGGNAGTGAGTGAATAAGTGTGAGSGVSGDAVPPVAPAACPPDMALVDGEFCPQLPYDCVRPTGAVGCAEFARGQRCLEPTDHRRFCVDKHEWPNKIGENPRVWVDWFEAKQLCASVGKRLCRRSEWMLACEGPKRLPFPWGFVRQPSPCNVDRPALGFDIDAMVHDATRDGELDRLWQGDKIGSHPDCVSAYGAYDMTGNVDEWTDNQADDPGTKYVSTLNGGYWGPVRNTCRLATKSHGPTFQFYQVGFRCCGDTIDGVPVPKPLPFVEQSWHKPD